MMGKRIFGVALALSLASAQVIAAEATTPAGGEAAAAQTSVPAQDKGKAAGEFAAAETAAGLTTTDMVVLGIWVVGAGVLAFSDNSSTSSTH